MTYVCDKCGNEVKQIDIARPPAARGDLAFVYFQLPAPALYCDGDGKHTAFEMRRQP